MAELRELVASDDESADVVLRVDVCSFAASSRIRTVRFRAGRTESAGDGRWRTGAARSSHGEPAASRLALSQWPQLPARWRHLWRASGFTNRPDIKARTVNSRLRSPR